MFCKNCGNILPEGAKFCTSCGAPVERSTNANADFSRSHETGTFSASQIGFKEAVIRYFTRFTDFSGRSRRSEYWWAVLFTFLVSALVSTVVPDESAISRLVSLVFFVLTLSLTIRRLHDVGKSGLFFLFNFIPVFGQLYIFILTLKDSAPDNQWGPNPKYQ